MKKFISIILAVVLCLSLAACSGGVQLDENEVVKGNGTPALLKRGITYTLQDGTIYADSTALYTFDDITTEQLFTLGEYLYVNTQKGAMQLTLDGKKTHKFGSGEIIGAKGKFIYYQSEDNKVGSMIVYKINMIDGSQRNLFQDTILEVKELENSVMYFKGESGNEYVNPLNDPNGYFYHEWFGEDVTEATE